MKKRAIFIGGCPRSGTTFLGSILGSTRHSIVTPESNFKQKIPIELHVDWSKGISKKKIINALSKNFRFKIWEIPIQDNSLPSILTRHDYRDLMYKLVDSYARKKGKPNWNVWIDHTPQNFQNALMLLEIFPNAKFIHIVRDPRAIAASIIPLNWGPNNAKDVTRYWSHEILFAVVFESIFPEKCLKVKYEDIVRYPEKTIKEICDYADIEFEDSMIFGKGFEVPEYTKSQHALIGKAPDLKRIDSWKKDLTDLQIYQIEKYLKDLLVMLGYDRTDLQPVTGSKIERIIIKIKECQLLDAIKKRKYLARKKKYGKKTYKKKK